MERKHVVPQRGNACQKFTTNVHYYKMLWLLMSLHDLIPMSLGSMHYPSIKSMALVAFRPYCGDKWIDIEVLSLLDYRKGKLFRHIQAFIGFSGFQKNTGKRVWEWPSFETSTPTLSPFLPRTYTYRYRKQLWVIKAITNNVTGDSWCGTQSHFPLREQLRTG